MHFDRVTRHNHITIFGYALLTRTTVDLLRKYCTPPGGRLRHRLLGL